MIIGGPKKEVIENIRKATEDKKFNSKVEVNDPVISQEEKRIIIKKYLLNKRKLTYIAKNYTARHTVDFVAWFENRDTIIDGLEKVENIKTGAIITNNHFNPLDSTVIRQFSKKLGKKKLYIISNEANLLMKGTLGFLMNNADIIPISNVLSYMKKDFPEIIEKKLAKNNFILIYPEQEMWFNYRKPRPPKPGAYFYATKNNVPIISCFTEMIDEPEMDNNEFRKVRYVLHILDPIYPDQSLSEKENIQIMQNKDYEQKKEAYERCYNKPLDYTFEPSDIAGYVWN